MILLIKLDISTKWWTSISSYPWIAVNRRLKFGSGKGAAPFQSAIVYLGNRIERFNDTFEKYGPLYVCATCGTVPTITQTPLTRAMITE